MRSFTTRATVIGPVTTALTALGVCTERAPGPPASSTVMPSTIRPPESIGLAAMGAGQVSVS